MRIERIDIYHVNMPMKATWRAAFGDEEAIDSVIVHISASGHDGWGESAPYRSPRYSPEWADGAFRLLRDWLGPAILGKDIPSGQALQRHLKPFKGNFFAKAALDIAWWDARGNHAGEPVGALIGGQRPDVTVGADIGVQDTIDGVLAAVESSLRQGYARVKLKFQRDSGLETVRAVREAFPKAVVHIDCNSSLTLDDLPLLKQLDRFELAMIEQPLAYDDLLDHARLQEQLQTPLCLDESITTLDSARKAIELGACRWINIKVGRVGGITNALAIHDHCQDAGIPCWIGGMLESSLGQASSLAVATLPNVRYPSDIFPSARFYHQDLSEPEIVLSGPSTVAANTAPGLGFSPNADQLRAHAVQRASLVA